MKATLLRMEAAAVDVDRTERSRKLALIAEARGIVASIHGSREDIAGAFSAKLALASHGGALSYIEVPDLVGLVGVERAAALLKEALATPAQLRVPNGEKTRELARAIALENAASLRTAQWGLVDSIDADRLYEVLQQRFSNVTDQSNETLDVNDYARGEADIYYLLSKIVAGQMDKAEAILLALAEEDGLYLPKDAVKALQRANQNAALVNFLHAMLAKHPELQAWDVYVEQASYMGRSQEALALVRQLLARKELGSSLRVELERREVDALLAANRVDEGVALLQKQIAGEPRSEDRGLAQSTKNALRLARIGQLLKRPALVTPSLEYAKAALELKGDDLGYERAALLKATWAAYRRDGKADLAQALAVSELQRPGANAGAEHYGIPEADAAKRSALVELAGLYGVENRHEDVLALLAGSRKWGARNLDEFIADRDSLEVPVGVTAARALVDNGKPEAAVKVLRALLDRMPGYDPAYELYVRLTGDRAVAELDARYAKDKFEERPLIWKAHALLADRQLDAAERTINQAIAIDPSDAEQGKNDRLRAYSVLANIVEAKGDKRSAATYRKALEAIRISQNADDFHAVGLFDRAFVLYRDALGRFADAYCIQSRLAIQLTRQGRHAEAVAHYRRAYELMPESFGRVESHCFGCESVFADQQAQGIADSVFQQAIVRDRMKPQTHYLLGYLREEQGRYDDALQSYRNAVALDGDYLNAWKRFNELGQKIYIDADERDIARLKLLKLDPAQRHVQYDLQAVRNLPQLWNDVETTAAVMTRQDEVSYRLVASADMYDAALAKLPPEIRLQMEQYAALVEKSQRNAPRLDPQAVLFSHALVKAAAPLLGGATMRGMDY